MALPTAIVRNLVICERIEIQTVGRTKVDLFGVLTNLNVLGQDTPYVYPELCVYAALGELRGPAKLQIRCSQNPEGKVVFTTPPYHREFPNHPLQVIAMPFRIRNCPFPQLGL